jgi:hypothetical protein
MRKNKTILLISLFLLISCDKRNPIEKTFITNDNDYWGYYNQKENENGAASFKFHKNNTYDNFVGFYLSNSDGDVIDDYRVWSVTADSILTLTHRRDVVKYNENIIILGYGDHLGYSFLIKENKKQRGRTFQKRRFNHPEKYIFNKNQKYGNVLENSIGKTFVTADDEYWAYYTKSTEPGFDDVYYKFNKNGTYDRYLRNDKDEFILSNNEKNRFWHAEKDSIITWHQKKEDVDMHNEDFILLIDTTYANTFLIKEKKGDLKKRIKYYIEKRKKHPEKYPPPF